jgi:PAS domain S-box-containing protein
MPRFEGRAGSLTWNKVRSQQARTARVANRNRPDSGVVHLCTAERPLEFGCGPWLTSRKSTRSFQSSPHPAWLATTKGHCVYANPALERLTGFNSDQINQADWRSFLLEEHRAVASASWQRSLATGTPYRECVELIAFGRKAGDGTELWLFTGLHVNGVAAQKCGLVVVELKQGSFKPEIQGPMELYLRWLAQNEHEPDENLPLGIIL